MRHHRGPSVTDPDYVESLYNWAGCHPKKTANIQGFGRYSTVKSFVFVMSKRRETYIYIYITQLGFGRGVSKRGVSSKKDSCKDKHAFIWLVVSTHFKNMSQNGFIFPKDPGETKKYVKPPHTMGTHNPSLLGVVNPYLGA